MIPVKTYKSTMKLQKKTSMKMFVRKALPRMFKSLVTSNLLSLAKTCFALDMKNFVAKTFYSSGREDKKTISRSL